MADKISYWKALSQDPLSCVKLVKNSLHLALPPSLLTDVRQGVKKVLDEKVSQFDPKLDGLLVAYNNIKVTSPSGTILIDKPYIHLDIAGEFYVFAPKEGTALKGIVNKKSSGHLGCLVHELFNASIPKPPNVSPDNWFGSKFELGDEVCFTVTRLNLKAPPLPGIYGELDPKTPVPVRSAKPIEVEPAMSDSGISTSEGVESTTETPKKEKKKKKKANVEAQPTPEATPAVTNEETPSKKTKKKPQKLDLPPPAVVTPLKEPESAPAVLEGSSKKKGKKIKKEEGTPSVVTTPQPSKLEEIRQRLLDGVKARLSPAASSDSDTAKAPSSAVGTPKSAKKAKTPVTPAAKPPVTVSSDEQLRDKLLQELRASFVEDKGPEEDSSPAKKKKLKRKETESSPVVPTPKAKKAKMDPKVQIKTEKMSEESDAGQDETHDAFVKELLAKYAQSSTPTQAKKPKVKKEKKTEA